MENDKFQSLVLETLAKISQDITELKQSDEAILGRLDGHDSRLSKIEASIIRIENDHGDKLRALFDAWESQKDFNRQLLERFDRIDEKLEQLSLKVSTHDAILKQVK